MHGPPAPQPRWERFKQYAIARQVNESVAHLSSRISRNGWIYGPSFACLEWLAQTPVSQVGAVPRFAVVRWALGEDADLWLPLRGRVIRTSPCAWCGRSARNYPAGPAYGALCFACTGQRPGLPEPLSDDLLKSLSLHSHTEDKGLTGPNCIFPPIADKLLSAPGPAAQVAPIPCVLCQRGANSIDHWLTYCPVIYGAWLLLWKGVSPPIDWQSTPNRHTGVALCYLLFHARRLVTEYGGLRPSIERLKLRPLQRHVLDLWQRIYQSLPATLLQWFRAPPLHHDLPCTNTMHIRVRRFPQTQIDSALLPDRGLCTSRAFSKDEVIATFGSSDVRLRYLLTQYRRLPFPAATAALLPYTCSCGMVHFRLHAMDDVPNNAILLIGEASNWQGCLAQFDGSAHKRTQTGGAGVSLLHVTQETTTLVRWKSIPLVPCADNVVAEASACLAAIRLAIEYHRQCLTCGIPQKGIVIQGDILPLLNYLQGKGRVKRPEVVRLLEDCQCLLARAPFIFRLVYLPRECNKLADYFAGQASAVARAHHAQPLAVAAHRAVPPYHLAQKLGFVIESGPLEPTPAFVLTECPAASNEGLDNLLSQLKSHVNAVHDYLAITRSSDGKLTVGYKPSSSDGCGRFYAVGFAAQQLPRQVRLFLFGHSHCEIDISGAHYELTRRCCAHAGVHRSLAPIRKIREWLKAVLVLPEQQVSPGEVDGLIKKWPLVIINSDSPREALAYLSRQLPRLAHPPPAELTRFAHELHAASRFIMHNPPSWCPARDRVRSRADPFRFFEALEQQLTWAAYCYLQPLVGFQSTIWLHDGFWASPCPTKEHLTELHRFIADRYQFSPHDLPLFCCELLQRKYEELLSELSALPLSASTRRKRQGNFLAKHSLPPQTVFRLKRVYQADNVHAQVALEERLAKRARGGNTAKRQRLA